MKLPRLPGAETKVKRSEISFPNKVHISCMVAVSIRQHHGMHHQRGSVGGAALHPREELWLHQRGGGAGSSGRRGGNSESEGISTLDADHSSGKAASK